LKGPAEEGLESGTKGVQMVQEILSAANLKKGTIQYKMEACDLRKILHQVVDDQQKNADAKGLVLHLDIPGDEVDNKNFTSTVDCEQIKHVYKNLVDNAIKYTPKGEVKVTMSSNNGKILFSVKDSGVGINMEDRQRLFTEGGNGKNSLKINVDSTGFGLYIAKKIVEAHEGKIWFDSEGEGKGSTFYVEIPIKI
jgi:signal transduction histidine kinase